MGSLGKFFYYILPPPKKKNLNMDTSLRERTAQNARSFKLSDVRTLSFDNLLIALHSFSFTQKIKDHSSLLSVRSIYKSDVPSSANFYYLADIHRVDGFGLERAM
jgi:hypothetical protein